MRRLVGIIKLLLFALVVTGVLISISIIINHTAKVTKDNENKIYLDAADYANSIQRGLDKVCYQAIEKKSKYERRLRIELIKTLYEYKQENCKKDDICGYKILWIQGCLAKVQLVKNDKRIDTDMIYKADFNSNAVGWGLIEANVSKGYFK